MISLTEVQFAAHGDQFEPAQRELAGERSQRPSREWGRRLHPGPANALIAGIRNHSTGRPALRRVGGDMLYGAGRPTTRPIESNVVRWA